MSKFKTRETIVHRLCASCLEGFEILEGYNAYNGRYYCCECWYELVTGKIENVEIHRIPPSYGNNLTPRQQVKLGKYSN